MKKVVLHIKDENLSTVMTVLTSLKAGLIDSIEGEVSKKRAQPSYVPNSEKAIDANEKPSGKYASSSMYKSRLRKNHAK